MNGAGLPASSRVELVARRADLASRGLHLGAAVCDAAIAALDALGVGPDAPPAQAERVLAQTSAALEALLSHGTVDGAELAVLSLVRVLISLGHGAAARAHRVRFARWAEGDAVAAVLLAREVTEMRKRVAEHDAAHVDGDHRRRASARAALELASASGAHRTAARLAEVLAAIHEGLAEHAEALLCRHHAWRLTSRLGDREAADAARRSLAAALRRVTRAVADRGVLRRLARSLGEAGEGAFAVELLLRAGREALRLDADLEALETAREAGPMAERLRDERLVIEVLELEAITHRKLGDEVRARSCESRLQLLRITE